MKQTIKRHLIISVVVTFFLLLPDHLFKFFNEYYVVSFSLKNVLPLFLLSFLTLSIKSKTLQYSLFGFYILLCFIQLAHFNFFGGLLSPNSIMMFFTEFTEVSQTLSSVWGILILPFLLSSFSLLSIFIIIKKYHDNFYIHKISHSVVIVLLLILPVSAIFGHSSKKFEPKIKSYSIKNSFYAVSYFLGNDLIASTLNIKDTNNLNNFKKYSIKKSPIDSRKKFNIVMIMGESISYRHLSLFGYKRDTTPLLNSLKDDPNFVYRKIISSGVSTKVSIPMFFNMQRDPKNILPLLRYESNLVKLAKEQGFITYVYSKQDNTAIASYLPTKYIDKLETTQNYNAPDAHDFDTDLHQKLQNIDFDKNNFIVLHQRACHSPYEKMYPKEFEEYPVEKVDIKTFMKNSYDNCIKFQDKFLFDTISILKEKTTREDQETLLFFVSDHAEYVGEHGKFGHTILELDVARIPFFAYGINSDFISKIRNNQNILSHYDVSKIVAKALNVEVVNPNDDNKTIFINGNELNGKRGFLSFDRKEILEKL